MPFWAITGAWEAAWAATQASAMADSRSDLRRESSLNVVSLVVVVGKNADEGGIEEGPRDIGNAVVASRHSVLAGSIRVDTVVTRVCQSNPMETCLYVGFIAIFLLDGEFESDDPSCFGRESRTRETS